MSQTPAAESRRRSDTPITLTYSDGTEAARPPERAPAPNLEVSVTTEPPAPYKHGEVIRFWTRRAVDVRPGTPTPSTAMP